jgi:hypothetical protein
VTALAISGTSPIRSRRTKADIEQLESDLYDIVEEIQPATVRQVFYQAVSRGVIPKTEAAYKGIVCRLLSRLRRGGDLPYGWIADNTRWMRKPYSYTGLQQMLEESVDLYRRDLWAEQDAYVEVWLEKDALAGVVIEVTRHFDVPLMVTRGYPSLTFVAGAADAMRQKHRPIFIYYFGDRDPSGVDIPRFVEKELREQAPRANITFEFVAVTEEQIIEMDLLTRPTKKTDSRSGKFRGESVEVDAIPPARLLEIVTDCIVQHLDAERYYALRETEAAERKTLAQYVAGWSPA